MPFAAFAEIAEYMRLGTIVSIDAKGRPIVKTSDEASPIVAQSLVTVPKHEVKQLAGKSVLLLQSTELGLNIIVGFVQDSIVQEDNDLAGDRSKARLELQALDVLSLVCGKSSIELRKDGKVLVSGEKIVSRGKQSNRITGGTVTIN